MDGEVDLSVDIWSALRSTIYMIRRTFIREQKHSVAHFRLELTRPYNNIYCLAFWLHFVHLYLCRPCAQMPDPPQSLHLLFCLPWLQSADPPHCLHQCFCLPCAQMLPPPHSTHRPFLRPCPQIYFFTLCFANPFFFCSRLWHL